MGLFDFPRIHIFGKCEVNPGTGNNNSASPGDELTVTSDSERVAPIGHKSDDEYRRWMCELDEVGALRAQWNYYGDMAFRFTGVTVGSVQLGVGQLLRSAEEDTLIGASVHLNNAIVCDNNPEGFNGTQVFAEALEIHASNALRGAGSFVSRPPDRATTRWLNWQRNVSFQTRFKPPQRSPSGEITSGAAGGASATFQCGIRIAAEDLIEDHGEARQLARSRFKLLPDGDQSPALLALVAALRGGATGVVFRYNLYLCYPRISDTELAECFRRGERRINPALGEIIGTISPWYGDREPSTFTLGRLLSPAAPYPNAYRRDKTFYLSPAVAEHDRLARRLSIDLANCLPEDGPEGDKYNLGDVTIGIRAATPANQDPRHNDMPIHTLGRVTNDRATYLACGGIYDVPYAGPNAGAWLDDVRHELVLHSSLYGVLLYEPEYMLASDCSCNYLDELPPGKRWTDADVRAELAAQPHAALRGNVDLWLRRRGKPPAADVPVTVEEWRQTPTGFAGRYGEYRYPALLSRRTIALGEHGRFDFEPSPGPGVRLYRFVPEHNWPQDITEREIAERAVKESIVELRILPHDDYSEVRDDELDLDFIYRTVFRYYHLVTPAMSEAMDLRDPSIWEMPSAARYVLLTSSQNMWGSWQYMPRTRDLSRARRELLHRFCKAILRRHGAPE